MSSINVTSNQLEQASDNVNRRLLEQQERAKPGEAIDHASEEALHAREGVKFDSPMQSDDGIYPNPRKKSSYPLDGPEGRPLTAEEQKAQADGACLYTTSGRNTPPPLSGPVGYGIPYPTGWSPSDRGYLRPLQSPLFDSEYIDMESVKIDLFKTPIDGFFQSTVVQRKKKWKGDTNLNQSGKLDCPIEFSILGFNLILDPTAAETDRNEALKDGLLTFGFSGHRPYLQVPLIRMPELRAFFSELNRLREKNADQWRAIQKENTQGKLSREEIDQMVELQARSFQMLKFNLGKSALKIKPGEEFYANIEYPSAPRVSRPVKATLLIEGLMWAPL